MDDTDSPSPSRSTRMSRNTACTRCRTSKVRCHPDRGNNTNNNNRSAGDRHRPCQRCVKLGVSCVVDPSYRRVTRKSQLDQLAREVQAIKDTVVNNRGSQIQQPSATDSWPERWGHDAVSGSSPHSAVVAATDSAVSISASEHHERDSGAEGVAALRSAAESQPLVRKERSLPRALNSQPFTGQEIDACFDSFFQHFHPYFPVLTTQDPNSTYETSQFLFWTVILITLRRRHEHSPISPALHTTTIQLLSEYIKSTTDATITKTPLSLPHINAILLVAAWAVYPGTRFINDPAHWLTSVALNSCLMLGLHTRRGRHAEFTHISMSPGRTTDAEAAVTWAACYVLSRTVSGYLGLPSTVPAINKATRNMIHDDDGVLPPILRVQLECQVFMDRVNKTISSCVEELNGVPSEVVRMFEDEWIATTARLLVTHSDPIASLYTMFILQDVQACYLFPIPSHGAADTTTMMPSPALQRDILRCYTTAVDIIAQAVALDESTGYLAHMPHFSFRSITSSIGLLYRVIRSDLLLLLLQQHHPSPTKLVDAAQTAAANALKICPRVSAMEGDPAWRLARCVELWQTTSKPYLAATAAAAAAGAATANSDDQNPRATLPRAEYDSVLVETFRQRMTAGVSFDFMMRWKNRHGPVPMGRYGQPLATTMAAELSQHAAAESRNARTDTAVDTMAGSSGTPPGAGLVAPPLPPPAYGQQAAQQQHPQIAMQTSLDGGGSSFSANNAPGMPLSSGGVPEFDPVLCSAHWGFLDDFGWDSCVDVL